MGSLGMSQAPILCFAVNSIGSQERLGAGGGNNARSLSTEAPSPSGDDVNLVVARNDITVVFTLSQPSQYCICANADLA